MKFNIGRLLAAIAGTAALSVSLPVSAQSATEAPAAEKKEEFVLDVDAAEALARREDCFKCHTVDKQKDGPSFKKVAAKNKNKPDAEQRMVKHLTSGEFVKLPNGDEEEHRIVKTKDEKALLNMVRWILSR